MLGSFVLVLVLAACGSSAGVDSPKDTRCASAQKVLASTKKISAKLQAQAPDADMKDFFVDLARGTVNVDVIGLVEMQQRSLQVVSDNPKCFGVARVADARRGLNVINPAMAEATRMLAAEPS